MVWSVLGRLTPTQPLVMQSDAIRGRGGPKGLISTYTFLFTASWNESTALYRFVPCVRVHTLAQISATTDSVNRHECHTVGDLFKFNKARWIVGRCIGFFMLFTVMLLHVCMFECVYMLPVSHGFVCVHAAHHRLFGDVHQRLNVVILVLLEGREEHVQHELTFSSHHLPFSLLFLLILHLRPKLSIKTDDSNINDS